MEKLVLSIVSPEKAIFNGEVERVTLPGTLAPFTVLPGHAPVISSLEKGIIKFVVSGQEQTVEVQSGGFMEKSGGEISVCIY